MAKNNLTLVKPSFFLKPTTEVAKALLGTVLQRTYKDGQVELYRIVETESYLGNTDPAAHTFRGITTRTAPMFEDGGITYVYQIYGLHYCLNFVTAPKGQGEAVLIRALEPIKTKAKPGFITTNGPGKLCKALKIDKQFNYLKLYEQTSPLQLFMPPQKVSTASIASTPRIGISHEEAKKWPLRFFISGNAYVSKGPFFKG